MREKLLFVLSVFLITGTLSGTSHAYQRGHARSKLSTSHLFESLDMRTRADLNAKFVNFLKERGGLSDEEIRSLIESWVDDMKAPLELNEDSPREIKSPETLKS